MTCRSGRRPAHEHVVGRNPRSRGPRAPVRRHRHFAGALDPAWLASLPLPIGQDWPAEQPVALLDVRYWTASRQLQHWQARIPM